MRLPFRIVQNKPLPKMDRKLKLIHVYTFDTGESIYTYDDSDLFKISNRYMKALSRNVAFLQQFGFTKEIYEKINKKESELIQQAIEGTRKPGEVIHDIKNLFDERDNMIKYNSDLNREQWEILFTMFFCLDGEDELNFSDAENAKKIELLRGLNDKEQEFFFHLLEKRLDYYKNTLSKDIATYMAEMINDMSKLESLKSLIEQSNSRSNHADTQESSTRNGSKMYRLMDTLKSFLPIRNG